MIKILTIQDINFEKEFNILLRRGNMDMNNIIPQVLATLQDIKNRGKEVLLELVRQYDNWNPQDFNELKIDWNLAENAYKKLDSNLKEVLKIAYDRIYDFHAMTKPKGFLHYDSYNNILGQNVLPVQRAGVYIPGGKAFYPSSLLMNVIPAKVAGVKDIIMTTPTPHNHINELVLNKENKKNLFKKVDVITGPGNIYVATAKKLVFGEVNVDMIAGPSEIGIIADNSANVEFLAIDMLSQAEHDEMASSIMITDSEKLAYEVAKEIDNKIVNIQRRDIAEKSINNRGMIIVVENLNQAVELMNEIAPEHLEILTQDPFLLLPHIKAAGAIFLGHYTPEAIGDYLAGPNHTLPTGGSARFFSPLNVEHFCTKSSLIAFSKQGLKQLAYPCATLAHTESLEAHKLSVLSRL